MKRPHDPRRLREQVRHEPRVVLLPDAGSDPEAVVVELANATTAVVTVLRPQTLPSVAVLAHLAKRRGVVVGVVVVAATAVAAR